MSLEERIRLWGDGHSFEACLRQRQAELATAPMVKLKYYCLAFLSNGRASRCYLASWCVILMRRVTK